MQFVQNLCIFVELLQESLQHVATQIPPVHKEAVDGCFGDCVQMSLNVSTCFHVWEFSKSRLIQYTGEIHDDNDHDDDQQSCVLQRGRIQPYRSTHSCTPHAPPYPPQPLNYTHSASLHLTQHKHAEHLVSIFQIFLPFPPFFPMVECQLTLYPRYLFVVKLCPQVLQHREQLAQLQTVFPPLDRREFCAKETNNLRQGLYLVVFFLMALSN